MFQRLLKSKKDIIAGMGYDVSKLGTHSFRKGATTFLSALPGGPPSYATLIRGGWSLGNVKNRYVKYSEAGDQYVGRCLSLCPILSASLAASPPFFTTKNGTVDDDWVSSIVNLQFTGIAEVFGFGRLLRMCTASLVYHHRWIVLSLFENHVIRTASVVLRNNEIIERAHALITFTFPWNDSEHIFTGVPPHVVILQELTTIRTDQRMLIDNFIDKVKEALTNYGVNSDRLTEQHLRRVLDEFRQNIQQQFNSLDQIANGNVSAINNNNVGNVREDVGTFYRPHFYGGKFHRVPVDWRFPRCGLLDLWRQWWIGDTIRPIPPLRLLKTTDINHIDNIPLDASEMHGRRGNNINQQRASSKIISDLRFVMKFVTDRAAESGLIVDRNESVSIRKINDMFAVSEVIIVRYVRDIQKQWMSCVKCLRKIKRENENNNNVDDTIEQSVDGNEKDD